MDTNNQTQTPDLAKLAGEVAASIGKMYRSNPLQNYFDEGSPNHKEVRELIEHALTTATSAAQERIAELERRLETAALESSLLRADLEAAKRERDEAQGTLETAGRHLKDYQGGGTSEDVIEACKELAAAYEMISDIDSKGETEGADDISQVVEWLHSWLVEARSERDQLRADLEAVRKLQAEFEANAKCVEDDRSAPVSDAERNQAAYVWRTAAKHLQTALGGESVCWCGHPESVHVNGVCHAEQKIAGVTWCHCGRFEKGGN